MKLLVLTDRYPPHYEGAYELHCYQVTEALRAKGYDVAILTTTYGVEQPVIAGQVYRVLRPAVFTYGSAWQRRMMTGRDVRARLYNYHLTQRLAQDIQPDLIFIWQMEHTSILPVLAIQDANFKTVFRIGSHWLVHMRRDYTAVRNSFKRLYRRASLGFHRFERLRLGAAIMVSESLLNSHKQAGFDTSQAVVIPTGISADWIVDAPARHPVQNPCWRFLYAGRLEHEKGVEVILAALQRLVTAGYTQVRVDFAGRGQPAYVAGLQQMVRAYGLAVQVRFLGFLPREALLDSYADYDALVFTSLRWEGLPTTIIEAMAKGLPVIASNIGGPSDIIVHQHNGLLVSAGDADALADALEHVIQQPDLLNQMAYGALETVRTQHTFTHMLARYEAVLHAALRE